MAESYRYTHQVSLLMIWNLVSSFLSIITFFIITKSLLPDQYGLYALILGMISTIVLFAYPALNEAQLRFAALTKNKSLLKYSLKLQYLIAIFILFVLTLFSKKISLLYNKPIFLILVIASFSFLFSPLIETAKSYILGRREIKKLIYLFAFEKISFLIFVLILLFLKLNTLNNFIIIYLFASFSTFLFACYSLNNLRYNQEMFNNNKFKEYAKSGFLFGLLKNWYLQIIIIIGALFVTSKEIGYYSFAIGIVSASLLQITNALMSMVVPYITPYYEKKDYETISRYFSMTIKLGLFLTTLLSVLLFFLLKFLILYLFPNYIAVMQFLPFVFFAYILLNFLIPMSFLKAKGKMNLLVKITSITSIFSLINTFVLSKYFGFNGIILSLITNILFYCVTLWIYSYKELKFKFSIIPNKQEIDFLGMYIKSFFQKFK